MNLKKKNSIIKNVYNNYFKSTNKSLNTWGYTVYNKKYDGWITLQSVCDLLSIGEWE